MFSLGQVGRCEWGKGLGLGFTNPIGTWRVWNMILCFGCGGVGAREGGWPESERVESRLFVYMAGTGIYIFY